MKGKVTGVQLIPYVDPLQELNMLVIDEIDSVYYLGSNSRCQSELLGQTIEYEAFPTTLKDGKTYNLVNDVSINKVINTVKEGLSLHDAILQPIEDGLGTAIDFDCTSMKNVGEQQYDKTFFVSDYELSESISARWANLVCVDKFGKIFTVRIFLDKEIPFDTLVIQFDQYKGHYCIGNIKKTKYGLNSDTLVATDEIVETLPAVVLGAQYIQESIINDVALCEYTKALDFFSNVEKRVNGFPGFLILEMLYEVLELETLAKISKRVNTQTLLRAIICTRGYAVTANNAWGDSNTTNCIRVNKIKELVGDSDLKEILINHTVGKDPDPILSDSDSWRQWCLLNQRSKVLKQTIHDGDNQYLY